MAKENYDELIDSKLMQLYETIKSLNVLKEKTEAVDRLVSELASAGKGRVAEIENAVGSLKGDMDKAGAQIGQAAGKASADLARTVSAASENAAKRVEAATGQCATAIEEAGRKRMESLEATAATFERNIQALVEESGKASAQMAQIIAELRGLPVGQLLVEFKKETLEQTGKIQDALERHSTRVEGDIAGMPSRLDGLKEAASAAAVSLSQAHEELKALSGELTKGQESIAALCRGNSADQIKKLGETAAEQAQLFKEAESRLSSLQEAAKAALAGAVDKNGAALRDAVAEAHREAGEGRNAIVKQLGEARNEAKENREAIVKQLDEARDNRNALREHFDKSLEDSNKQVMEATRKCRKAVVVAAWIVSALIIIALGATAPVWFPAWRALVK